jgi:phosphohistidine swiveling domain-containing protein
MVVGYQCVTWSGTGVSAGTASGPARVIRETDDLLAAASGEILVTRHGLPTMLPALLRARGAVCEAGGQLSHFAILTRELGKPCVTGLPGIVKAVETGDWLRVDGTRGVIEWNGSSAQAPDPADSLAPAMLPVLQFGRFTSAFASAPAPFTVETAVRVAALVSLPVMFALGPAWRFTITENRILVETAGMRKLQAGLVKLMHAGPISAAALGAEYRAGCDWVGWDALGNDVPSSAMLAEAVHRYARLNQLTWTAAIAKEPLTTAFETFLADRIPWLEQTRRAELLLDCLTMSGQSYILQTSLGHDPAAHTWSRTLAADSRLSPEPAEIARLRALAAVRRDSADRQLRSLLRPDDARRALAFVADIGALAAMTEGKNTQLHRCGAALFAGAERQRAVAWLLDLDLAKSDSSGHMLAVAEPARAVHRITSRLNNDHERRFCGSPSQREETA